MWLGLARPGEEAVRLQTKVNFALPTVAFSCWTLFVGPRFSWAFV